MLAELFADTFKYPDATKDLEIFPLMRIAGKLPFLTTWILHCQSVEMFAAAAGELLLLAGVPCPVLMTASYRFAEIAAGLGIMLTLLFLKFNYFEEKWRVEIAGTWARRGYPFFTVSLIGHLPSLPIAILDVAFVRDGRFLKLCNPALAENVGMTFVFMVTWYTFMHVLWWATNYQNWPYPFLHEFDTFLKRIILFAVVFAVFVVVILPIQLILA